MNSNSPNQNNIKPEKPKMEPWFLVAKLVLQNREAVLTEKAEKELNMARLRWYDPRNTCKKKYSRREMLITDLKTMRRSLIRSEVGKLPAWIEKSEIRRTWPELPEYRIRRLAIRGLLIAFKHADSPSDFHRRAPFYVEQFLRKMSCNSPHCIAFRINPRTGNSCCTRGSWRVF